MTVQPTTLEERAFNVTVVIFALVTFSSFVLLGGADFVLIFCGLEDVLWRSKKQQRYAVMMNERFQFDVLKRA